MHSAGSVDTWTQSLYGEEADLAVLHVTCKGSRSRRLRAEVSHGLGRHIRWLTTDADSSIAALLLLVAVQTKSMF